jgi:chromosome segregation ATPase
VEREMMKASDHSDLARENSLLRGSIEKLKLVLKERL